MSESVILAATLGVTLVGTGAVLYARLVKIETIVARQEKVVSQLFSRWRKTLVALWRVGQIEKRVDRLEAAQKEMAKVS